MLQKLSIALTQVKAGNNSGSLLNEIRQIVYNNKKKELLKKYTITWLSWYNYQHGYYIYELKK